MLETLDFPLVGRERAQAILDETWKRMETLVGEIDVPDDAPDGAASAKADAGDGSLAAFDFASAVSDVLGMQVEDVVGGGEHAELQKRAQQSNAVAGMAVMMLLFGLVHCGGTLLQEESRRHARPAAARAGSASSILLARCCSRGSSASRSSSCCSPTARRSSTCPCCARRWRSSCTRRPWPRPSRASASCSPSRALAEAARGALDARRADHERARRQLVAALDHARLVPVPRPLHDSTRGRWTAIRAVLVPEGPARDPATRSACSSPSRWWRCFLALRLFERAWRCDERRVPAHASTTTSWSRCFGGLGIEPARERAPQPSFLARCLAFLRRLWRRRA
jgi:hypothetical protein